MINQRKNVQADSVSLHVVFQGQHLLFATCLKFLHYSDLQLLDILICQMYVSLLRIGWGNSKAFVPLNSKLLGWCPWHWCQVASN